MTSIKEFSDISKLKIPAEQYEQNGCFNDFPKGEIVSGMHEVERKFIHGLVRFLKPKRILEIGVSRGGGTAILLNAIKDFKDCDIVSIDLRKGEKIGYFPKKMFPKSKNWKLFDGKDPSEIMEKLKDGQTFDFCVLDTAHIHPIESLNFLTTLPFLSNNAVIVVHDLIDFTAYGRGYPEKISHRTSFANKLLFDCLCGNKIKVKDKTYLETMHGGAGWGIQTAALSPTSGNIGAVQITKDTKKYINDVFSMLMFPWGLLPNYKHLKLISNIIKKYYSKENFKEFCNAVNLNLNFIANGYSYKSSKNIDEKNIIFYGAGNNCKDLLNILGETKEIKPMEIWDMSPKVKNIRRITVKQPDFTPKEKYKNFIIVITIGNEIIANEVKKKLNKCKFSRIYLYEEFMAKMYAKKLHTFLNI